MRIPTQLELLAEIIETTVTRDQPFEDSDGGGWGTYVYRPIGAALDRLAEAAS